MNIVYNPALLNTVHFSTLDVGECFVYSDHLMMKIGEDPLSNNAFNFDSHAVASLSSLTVVFKVQVDAFVRYV